MILGVNGIRLVGKRSGVGRAIEAVLGCLDEVPHPFSEVRVYTPQPLGDDVVLPRCAINVVLRTSLSNAMWEQFVLMKAHGSKNLLFCPSYVIPLLAKCPTLLVHHGSYEGYPRAFDWWTLNKARAIYTLSAWRATSVATVSEYSKRDMVNFYRLRPERIQVVPEGVDTRTFKPLADEVALSQWRKDVFGSDVPFIVYVGKPTERRNLSSLIKAFALLKKDEKIPHKMLIVGAELPGTSPFRRVIQDLKLSDDVSVRGYVGHDEMPLVYNATDLFVYPSSYEGFGMPVLEAMACGAPVIALNNTVFPEFAGGVARLLKDAQVQTLREGIREVLFDREFKTHAAEAGPRRATAYDWRLVTRRYVDLMSHLLN
jgi:glycosyltransferase involved in cell wall biosynthesis